MLTKPIIKFVPDSFSGSSLSHLAIATIATTTQRPSWWLGLVGYPTQSKPPT